MKLECVPLQVCAHGLDHTLAPEYVHQAIPRDTDPRMKDAVSAPRDGAVHGGYLVPGVLILSTPSVIPMRPSCMKLAYDDVALFSGKYSPQR